MPNPNAVVSTFIRFEAAPEHITAEALRASGGLSIELEGGRRARLNPEDPKSVGYAQILAGLSRQHLPVYLDLDPDSSEITRLLIPHLTRIAAIGVTEDGALDIQLELSSARHHLLPMQEDFAVLEKQLREALQNAKPVLLTEDDEHNIIDVRYYMPVPDGPEVPLPPFPPSPPEVPRLEPIPENWLKEFVIKIWNWCWWPWWWFRCKCISQTKAQQVFDAMNATSCDPLTVPPPCIPFLYPDDGCWARAHEMCRLMINMGVKPKKVWIQGSLAVSTANNPTCNVYWGWHVAPTLCVRTSWFFATTTMVIDPSLFTTPVTRATWKSVQGDPGATLTDSPASIYYLWGSVTDPGYTQTNYYLNYYRLQLQNRSLTYGPPPYACP